MNKTLNKTSISLLTGALAVSSCFLGACSGTERATSDQSPEEVDTISAQGALTAIATDFVVMLSAGNFSGAVSKFDTTLSTALPEAALKQTWDALTQQVGTFASQGSPKTTTEAGFEVVYIPCSFERGTVQIKIVFASGGQIAGLYFE